LYVKNVRAKQISAYAYLYNVIIIMRKKNKWIVFREEERLVRLIDCVVEVRGMGRSDFIREAVRKRLAELDCFTKDLNPLRELHTVFNDALDSPVKAICGSDPKNGLMSHGKTN